MIANNLESLIRSSIALPHHPSSKGWWVCACPICSDYKKRAGFKFDQDAVVFHCFNCNHNANYDPTQTPYINDYMVTVLTNLNIDENEYKALTFNYIIQSKKNNVQKEKIIIDPDTELIPISCPKFFVKLDPMNGSLVHQQSAKYIKSRYLDPNDYPYMVVDPDYQCADKQETLIYNKWKNRLIIPYYRSKKLIWYQGRDLSDNSKMRYLNASTPSECILGNHDALNINSHSPLYITEGFFDSMLLNGVCIFGNTFKKGQLKLLDACRREKIYIPDNTKDAQTAALQALRMGWKISIPDIGSCKDISAARGRFGKLYIMKTLYDHVLTDTAARLRIQTLGLNNTLTKKKIF